MGDLIKIRGLESFLEAIYLEVGLVERTLLSEIEVNPMGIVDYIVGKTVVINCTSFPLHTLKTLTENNNKVYSRVTGYEGVEGVRTYPYIMRPNFHIMWNGEIHYCPEECRDNREKLLEWIGETERLVIRSSPVTPFLSFPKIYGIGRELLFDAEGHLSSLGWALHQVGVNLCPEFMDMDLLKTKKIII